jgi:hypothetical protein
MFSLTITELQGIIPKLMALQRGWFKHARRDFGRFASLGTKRIGTRFYLTLPWVIKCPNTPLCFISLLTFHFLGDIPFHLLPLLLKWTRLWTWTLQPLGQGHRRKGCSIQDSYAHGHGELVHCTTSRHFTICTHTRR